MKRDLKLSKYPPFTFTPTVTMAPRRSLRASVSGKNTPVKRSRSSPSDDDRPAKRTKTTPSKSKYFHTEESIAKAEDIDSDDDGASSPEAEVSGYEDEDASVSELSDDEVPVEEEDDEEVESEEEDKPRRRKKGGATKSKAAALAVTKTVKGKELWRPDVKTGLGAGIQVVIDKPKARPAGKIPYSDDTVHSHTMLFLQELSENNDREWLKMHDPTYRQALKDSNTFFEELQTKIIELDETIPELPMKDITFRIYRDIRFSPDPTPYKTHFSAAWSRTGRKGPFAAYYCQIKPGGSFVGGGLWMPEASALAALRKDIDKKAQNLKDVLLNDGIRKQFFSGIKKDEKLVMKAFADQNKENALKTKPRDYAADHKYIQLLRLRNFTIGRKLKDEEIVGNGGIDRVAEVIKCLVPFVTYLNSIVMPDAPLQYSEEEDSEDSEDGGVELSQEADESDSNEENNEEIE
jgi:uncharacterized protein (TIGR02453 family)